MTLIVPVLALLAIGVFELVTTLTEPSAKEVTTVGYVDDPVFGRVANFQASASEYLQDNSDWQSVIGNNTTYAISFVFKPDIDSGGHYLYGSHDSNYRPRFQVRQRSLKE